MKQKPSSAKEEKEKSGCAFGLKPGKSWGGDGRKAGNWHPQM